MHCIKSDNLEHEYTGKRQYLPRQPASAYGWTHVCRYSQQQLSSTPSAAKGLPLGAPGQAPRAPKRLRKEGGAGPASEQAALSSSAQLSTAKQV